MTICPKCSKRLLSQASACCNWCGAPIEDAEYQAQAQTEREAYYAHTSAHDLQSLAATEALWLGNTNIDPFMPAPIRSRNFIPPVMEADTDSVETEGTSARMPGMKQPPEANDKPIQSEAEEAGERFRHLEI